MGDIYERLRDRLDEMATGYPSTPSGAEIRILRQLFREEEAELFLVMSPIPETVDEVASRVKSDTAFSCSQAGRNGSEGPYLQAS